MPRETGQLVRIACEGATQGMMERALGRLEFTEGQLIQMSNRLASARDLNCLIRGNVGEVCMVLDAIRGPQSFMPAYSGQDSGIANALIVPYHFLGLAHRDLCEYVELNWMTLNPRPTSMLDFVKNGQLAEARRRAIPKSHIVLHLMSPGVGRMITLYGRYCSGQICAQVALAVQRYHLKTQKLPDTLAALVPEFLDEEPVDPFDGKPIRYIKHSKGFRVYSVGEDGQDNGGCDRDPEDHSKPYDQVFSIQYPE